MLIEWSASERTDEVNRISDASLPFTGYFHAGLAVVDDQEGGRGQLQVVLLLEILGGPERTSAVGHIRAARVRRTAFILVVESSGLFEDKVAESVVTVAFGQHQREQQVEDDVAVVHAVTRNVGHEPMPKFW